MGKKSDYQIMSILNKPVAKLFMQMRLSSLVEKIKNSSNKSSNINELFKEIQQITSLSNEQIDDISYRFNYILNYYSKKVPNANEIKTEYANRANLLKNNNNNNYSLLDFAGEQIKIGTFPINNTDLTITLDLQTLNLTISALQNGNNPKLVHYIFPPACEIEYFDFKDNTLKDGDLTADALDFITTLRFDSVHTTSGQIHFNSLDVLNLDKDSEELQLYNHYYTSAAKTPHVHFYQKRITEGLEVLRHIEIVENPSHSGYYEVTYDGKVITRRLHEYFPNLPKGSKFRDYVKHIQDLKSKRGNTYSFAIHAESIAKYLEDLNNAIVNNDKNSPLLKFDLGMPFLSSFNDQIYSIANTPTTQSDTVSESNDNIAGASELDDRTSELGNQSSGILKNSNMMSRQIACACINNKFEHTEELLKHVAEVASDYDAKNIIENHAKNVHKIITSNSSYQSKSILILSQLYKCINDVATYLTKDQLTSFMHFITNYSYNNFALSNDFSFKSTIVASYDNENEL